MGLRRMVLALTVMVISGLVQGCGDKVEPAIFNEAAEARKANNWIMAVDLYKQFNEHFASDERGPEAMFYLGMGYEKLQDWVSAITVYTELKGKVKSKEFSSRAKERLAAIRTIGEQFRQEGDFLAAAKVFNALVRFYPTDPKMGEWQVALGFCSELAGEWEQAITAYDKYLAHNPKGVKSDDIRKKQVWLKPFSLLVLEDFRGAPDYTSAIKALRAFREEQKDHPRVPDALFWIAYAREYNLDYPDMAGAIATYTEFRKLYPRHKYAAQALYQIGHCRQNDLDNPDYEKALAVFGRVVAAYPNTEWAERALFAKADICENMLERYEDAITAYRELLKPEYYDEARFQKFQYAHVRIGCIYKNALKDYVKARNTFNTILKADPDGWYAGRVYWQLKLIDRIEQGNI